MLNLKFGFESEYLERIYIGISGTEFFDVGVPFEYDMFSYV